MANTFLTRTSSSTGNRKTWTLSAWVKRSFTGTKHGIFGTYTDGNNRLDMAFDANDKITMKEKVSSSTNIDFTTTAKFRDTNAWYHIVFKVDTTQATEADRVKVYVNGTEITVWTDSTYPSQNYDTLMNVSGRSYLVGQTGGGSNYWDGSMAHVHLTDGNAYTASTFGSTDSTTGIWEPTTGPSVTYGTNGFFLKFGNAASLGTDSSGQSNNFTKSGNGLQTKDNPNNNMAVINFAIPTVSQNCTVTNGGTTINSTSSAHRNTPASVALALGNGKFYWEMKVETMSTHVKTGVGFTEWSKYTYLNQGEEFSASNEGYAYRNDGQKENNGASSYGNSYTVNDIIGVAFDTENRKLFFAKNGTWQNSGDPAAGSNPAFTVAADFVYYPVVNLYEAKVSYNFGAGFFGNSAVASEGTNASNVGKFEYDVPTGFTAVTTKGLNL